MLTLVLVMYIIIAFFFMAHWGDHSSRYRDVFRVSMIWPYYVVKHIIRRW